MRPVVTVARLVPKSVRRRTYLFGLFYYCHELDDVVERLKTREQKEIKATTVDRYRNDAQNRVIEIITKSAKFRDLLKKAIDSK